MFQFSLLYAANPPPTFPPGTSYSILSEMKNLAQIPQTYKDWLYFHFTSVLFSVYYWGYQAFTEQLEIILYFQVLKSISFETNFINVRLYFSFRTVYIKVSLC